MHRKRHSIDSLKHGRNLSLSQDYTTPYDSQKIITEDDPETEMIEQLRQTISPGSHKEIK